MAKTDTMTPNEALYRTLKDGDATEAELRKALKMDDDEFDEFITHTKSRIWLDTIETSRTTRYALSDYGRMALAPRYPD